jgi:hypothetical protein
VIVTSSDGQWAAIRRGREVALLAAGTGAPVGVLGLDGDDVDVAIVGPPDVLVVVTRDGTPRVTLHQPPYLEVAARMDLDRPLRLAAITGPRFALLSGDGKHVAIVRVAGRAMSTQTIDPGSPAELVVGLERNQLLLGLLRKLEVWDAVAGRPLLRLQLQLPPPPRTVGSAQGHLWAMRPGTDEVSVYRLSDGRQFQHVAGSPIEAVVAHPASPILVLVTRRGLLRLHCFAHTLAPIEAPWAPGAALGQLVAGDDIVLLGAGAIDAEPWRAPIAGPAAPSYGPPPGEGGLLLDLGSLAVRPPPTTAAIPASLGGPPSTAAPFATPPPPPPTRSPEPPPAPSAAPPSFLAGAAPAPATPGPTRALTGAAVPGAAAASAGPPSFLAGAAPAPATAGPPALTGAAALGAAAAGAGPPSFLAGAGPTPTSPGPPPALAGAAAVSPGGPPSLGSAIPAGPAPARAGVATAPAPPPVHVGAAPAAGLPGAATARDLAPSRAAAAAMPPSSVPRDAAPRGAFAGPGGAAPEGAQPAPGAPAAHAGWDELEALPIPLPFSRPEALYASESDALAAAPPPRWREPFAALGYELVGGADGALLAIPVGSELDGIAQRLALGPAARRALVALYALHLVGDARVPIARLAALAGDWGEALGQGELGALGLLHRVQGGVGLAGPIADALDSAAPRAIRVLGARDRTGAAALGGAIAAGALRVPRSGRSDAELEAALTDRLGRYAVIEGAMEAALLEARLRGLPALAHDPPPRRPWPRPDGVLLLAVEGLRAPPWVSALPELPPA